MLGQPCGHPPGHVKQLTALWVGWGGYYSIIVRGTVWYGVLYNIVGGCVGMGGYYISVVGGCMGFVDDPEPCGCVMLVLHQYLRFDIVRTIGRYHAID